MSRLNRKISVSDSYKLAGIMGISNEEGNHIQCDPNYNGRSGIEKILSIYNSKETFSRKELGDYLREIKKLNLIGSINIFCFFSDKKGSSSCANVFCA